MFNNFGLLYADQGKMKEAEEMRMRALRERRRWEGSTRRPWTRSMVSGIYTVTWAMLPKPRQWTSEQPKGTKMSNWTAKLALHTSESNSWFSKEWTTKRIAAARKSTQNQPSLPLIE
jgi:hypothetical protein